MSNLSITARNAELEALSDLLDGGYIELRTGTQPTSIEDTATGTLVCTITLNTPSFGTAASGSMTLDTPSLATCGAAGTITYARWYTSGDAEVLDTSVSLSGGGGELIATETTLAINDTVSISYTHTIPE